MEYKTVQEEACEEFTERRSRFIGHAKPVTTEEEAIIFINQIKSQNWDANHNVYAYALRNGQIRRYSDDGEPQGTAGVPVLDVIIKTGTIDVVVVVTRYFGGVLLGTGGLVRAYSHGASVALEKAHPQVMKKCLRLEIGCDYNQYGKISSLIPECGGFFDDSQFLEEVTVKFHMAEEDLSSFEKKLADATSGKALVKITGENFFAI